MKQTTKSIQKRIAASQLMLASFNAPDLSATKLALIKAATKKTTVADAIDFIEEEKEHNEKLRRIGWKE